VERRCDSTAGPMSIARSRAQLSWLPFAYFDAVSATPLCGGSALGTAQALAASDVGQRNHVWLPLSFLAA
jgi:hypothetical protein